MGMLNSNPASAVMGDFKEPRSDLYSGDDDANNSCQVHLEQACSCEMVKV